MVRRLVAALRAGLLRFRNHWQKMSKLGVIEGSGEIAGRPVFMPLGGDPLDAFKGIAGTAWGGRLDIHERWLKGVVSAAPFTWDPLEAKFHSCVYPSHGINIEWDI